MNTEPTPQEIAQSFFGEVSPELQARIDAMPDDPVDLNATPRDKIADFECSKVLPTHAITRFLASGDVLTDKTIDSMELALETHYKITSPWCIVSERTGREADGNLAVDYFYLMRDLEEKEG